MYYYLFYKYYKLFEAFKPKQWTPDISAITLLMSLEIWIFFAANNYYDILSHQHGTLVFFSFRILIPFIIILLIKWLAFWRNDRWKNYIHKFDQLPEETNQTGTSIVTFITIFIFANLIFSFYLNPPPGGWK